MSKPQASSNRKVSRKSSPAKGEGGDSTPARLRKIAIACQGGGAQAAYTAGVLTVLLDDLLGGGTDQDDPKQWVGISGTSGGALSAAVAWFGALAGGREQAKDALRGFWEANSAQRPGERVLNTLGVLGLDLLNFDFQLNPYLAPLCQISDVQTKVWPSVAALMPPLATAMRPDYFLLDETLRQFVRFDIVGALGNFLSLPAAIDAWQAAGARDRALRGCGLRADGSPLAGRPAIPKGLRPSLEARIQLRKFADEYKNGLLARAFNTHWTQAVEDEIRRIEHELPMGDDALEAAGPSTARLDALLDRIGACIRPVRDALPHLLVGAVDVGSGEFVAFSSRRAPGNRGITIDALHASTAIPWLFRGVKIPGDDGDSTDAPIYWDGLFSQNPPISDLLSGAEPAAKPDEIWVAQVNPQRCDTADIENNLWDRRNELSGNLSLNQEVASVAAINARMFTAGVSAKGDDKRVQVLRIAMDSQRLERELGWSLGTSSKMDRSVTLMRKLFRHGEEQAQAFRPVRSLLELAWNAPGSGNHHHVNVEGLPSGSIAGLRSAFGARDAWFQVSDMTVENPEEKFGGARFPGEMLRCRISWQCRLQKANGQRERLEGIAVIGLDTGKQIVGARMTSIALSLPDAVSKHVGWRTLPRTV